jgi:hypothetical protein
VVRSEKAREGFVWIQPMYKGDYLGLGGYNKLPDYQ